MLRLCLFVLAVGIVNGLEVSNGSTCADTCDGPSLTFPSDISCSDDGYTTLAKGKLMKNCLECEAGSDYVDSGVDAPQDNDQYWLLFNTKFSLQYCLTQTTDGTPNFSECKSKCEGVFPALTPSWFTDPSPAQYDYCTISDNAFIDNAENCAACLQSAEGSVVLGNMLLLMKSGCDSRADAHAQNLIPVQRELFNTATVASSTSSSSSTTSTSSSSATATADDSSSAATTSDSSSQATATAEGAAAAGSSSNGSSGLSSGAAAGIGVSCGLGALVLGALLVWYLRKRSKKARAPARTPGSMSDGPPHYDDKASYVPVYNDHPSSHQHRTELPSPPVETNGHQRYEMGADGVVESPTMTAASELDSNPVSSRRY